SVSLGTSGVLFAALDAATPEPDGRVHLFAHADGGFHLLGVTLSAGGSLTWYPDAFAPGASYQELMQRAAESPPGANGVTFKPYLAGERSPHLRPDLRGSFHGLSLATSEADVVRAVLEGVAFSLREAYDAMAPLATPDRWLATGGGAESDLWLAVIATVLGAPLGRPAGPDGQEIEAGAGEGAAWLAWRAMGHARDREPLAATWFEPDEDSADALAEAFTRYKAGADL